MNTQILVRVEAFEIGDDDSLGGFCAIMPEPDQGDVIHIPPWVDFDWVADHGWYVFQKHYVPYVPKDNNPNGREWLVQVAVFPNDPILEMPTYHPKPGDGIL